MTIISHTHTRGTVKSNEALLRVHFRATPSELGALKRIYPEIYANLEKKGKLVP